MTSEEIVKALRMCVMDPDDGGDCENCPASRSEDEYCLTAVMSEAASLIEQLIDENTELREEVNLRGNAVRTYEKKRAKAEAERDALREKVPQWVSVEERLPIDRLKKYLVAFRDAGGPIVDMARYFPSDGWTCDNWDVPQKLVTHWMPLPEAPEEGGKA